MNRFLIFLSILMTYIFSVNAQSYTELQSNFISPPDNCRPGVYWYFMDGNMSKEALTKDLESMKKVGIGSVLFLEVNLGIPRGKVIFLSQEWQEHFKFIVSECERLGMTITLGIGPGWTGSGGPWVKPEESMRHLVSSSVDVVGGKKQMIQLPKPEPVKPYFGEKYFPEEIKEVWKNYYSDEFVLAFPTPDNGVRINDILRRAIYYRDPYTSMPSALEYIQPLNENEKIQSSQIIDKDKIIDLTSLLQPDGSINWNVPKGNWTIMRFGMCNNGALTRPAPMAGVGFECDKFDTAAFRNHFNSFVKVLFDNSNITPNTKSNPITTLHMDSWEMGAQNWGDNFRKEFIARRGYDPKPYLPVYSGMVVGSIELSDRFLWDMRITANELVLENHAEFVKSIAHEYGMNLSIEPYDMHPGSDLDLGAVADEPGCEFWNRNKGFSSAFSCIQAASSAHVMGRQVVMAEAFTTLPRKTPFAECPTSVKDQGDWAFCTGINRFYYHTFAHKSWFGDDVLPGMSMSKYGVNWDRGQTWWNMSGDYHKYITRCSYMLRQGESVADILYLTPEGVPHVFRAPPSAVTEHPDTVPDKRGYNFDGCSPKMLMDASVKDGNIVFPSGASYKVMVLPTIKMMTPELLTKIESLLVDGATIIGNPPTKSPSLTNYPICDNQVLSLSKKIWGTTAIPQQIEKVKVGKGTLYWGGGLSKPDSNSLYTTYESAAYVLKELNVVEVFSSDNKIRYIHRKTEKQDIWFVSNKTKENITAHCKFRTDKKNAEIWDAVTGKIYTITDFVRENSRANFKITFAPTQSFFVLFNDEDKNDSNEKRIDETEVVFEITEPWNVSFDTNWGGPNKTTFKTLTDWSINPDNGIKYYSGTAVYKTTFNYNRNIQEPVFLNLGEVHNMARVKLNGKDLGVVWTAPWQVDITDVLIKGNNKLEIEVVNLWINRLVGDEQIPNDGTKDGEWPEWLTNKDVPRTSGRYAFTVWTMVDSELPLLKSGLIGPVTIKQ